MTEEEGPEIHSNGDAAPSQENAVVEVGNGAEKEGSNGHSDPKPQPKSLPPEFCPNYLKSPLAFIRIAQIVCGIVFCCLVGSYCREHFESSGLYYRVCYSARYYYTRGLAGLAFELLIGSISILIAILFLALHTCGLDKSWVRVPWAGVEILVGIVMGFLFFVCWAIHAKYTQDRMLPLYHLEAQLYSQFIAATIFGVLCMVLQAVDVILQYRSWDG